MSGHSKWSTIKRKKAAIDAKRGKVFTRLLREVTVAARLEGGDPSSSPRLRSAVQDARASNVPNENIDRAIKKGTGELEGVAYDEVTYEGYGPGGVAVLVEAMTDNKNRTVGEVRHAFAKHGGNLGENGCVNWMFDPRGFFVIEPDSMDEESFLELALELEVEDVRTDGDGYELYAASARYLEIKETLATREVPVAVGQLAMIPQSTVALEDDQIKPLLRMLDHLEDLDDVQNVWANLEADERVLAAQDADA